MKFADSEIILNTGEGIEIAPGIIHQMVNNSNDVIHFLVISIPKSHGDKIIV